MIIKKIVNSAIFNPALLIIPEKLRAGSILIEIIVAAAIFLIIIAGVVPTYLSVFDSAQKDVDKLQAHMYLQQGLEATRSIRDQNFAHLANGTYGLSKDGGHWTFAGNSDVNGKFTRTINIADIQRNANCNIVSSDGTVDQNSKLITATISWIDETENQTFISSTQELNNWRNLPGCGEAANFYLDLSGAELSSGDTRVVGIIIKNLGNDPITIDKITPIWTNDELIREIKIGSTIVWKYNSTGSPSGQQPSGVELDIVNKTIAPNSGSIQLDHFMFNGDMENIDFTIYFKMADGTVRYENVHIND